MTIEIKAVSTTVSCQVSGGDGHLSAEVDSRPYGLNGGRSQYFPGDDCYILVYRSNNVTIDTSVDPISGVIKGVHIAGGTIGSGSTGASIVKLEGQTVGFNIVRESVSFNSPIAQAGKPLPADTRLIYFDSYAIAPGEISGPQFIPNTTVCRVKNFKGALDPGILPPSGFAFIEYSPVAEVWKLSNLPQIPGDSVFSWAVHVVFHGVARPMTNMVYHDLI